MKATIQAILYSSLLAFLAAATPAFADTIDDFTVTYDSTILTFSLPSSPKVDGTINSNIFFIDNVPLLLNGRALTAMSVDFFLARSGGGLEVEPLYIPSLVAAQLFTGSIDAPTFTTGTFATSPTYFGPPAIITISEATSSVPESGSIALFGTGVLCLIGEIRRRFSF
jgi:hypothetical protein